MLIRVKGGEEGAKEYLENGHKQGREYHRDQLDERVILAGDLDFTQQIIDRIEIDGERYLHITLSFKEDEISNDTLLAITEDFRRFMFAAYKEDEYTFYAEAHLPKIKSYENQKTGEVVERKLHIHFIVPKVNLRTGGVLNPFGLVKKCEKYLDGFQEHTNNKYGLASPKDSRRVHFTDTSDMIHRYKDDNFTGSNKELKKSILEAVLGRNITSYDDFAKLVDEFGETKVRNAGRENEYLNVKPDGQPKGVNLKDYPFTRQFIELPAEEKRRILTAEIQRRYDVQGQARKDPAGVFATLEEWYRFRAREIKYVNSGNRKLYKTYRAATPGEREVILNHLATRFYDKYPGPTTEPEPFTGKNPFDPEYGFKQAPCESVQMSLLDAAGVQLGQGRALTTEHGIADDGPGAGEFGRSGTDRSAFAPHPDRQQEPMAVAAFGQARSPGDPGLQTETMPHSGKNPIDRGYDIKGPALNGDSLDERPSRQRGAEPLTVFEQRHALSPSGEIPAQLLEFGPRASKKNVDLGYTFRGPADETDGWPHEGQQRGVKAPTTFEQTHTFNQARTAPATPIHHQEPNHERARYAGKNPVGHEYGYKRPGSTSDRDGARAGPGGTPGRQSGHDGGVSARAEGRRGGHPVGNQSTGGRYQLAAHPDRQHDIISLASVEKALTLDRVRRLPGGRMVRAERESAVLLPDHASDQLGNRPGRSNHHLRWPRDRQPVRGTGRVDDSVVSQIARDFEERRRGGAADGLPEFQEIKQRLDARRLLAELSRSHGVIVTKYQVTAAADGSARIRAGNRNLNVCDFMTKEMRLPWAEAATILRHSYSRQVDRHPEVAPKVPPSPTLWRQFQDQRRERGGLRMQLAAQLASERARQDALKERFDEARRATMGLSAVERKAALSVARMEYLATMDTLRATIRAERAPFRLPVAEQYRQFLQERAQAGDNDALTELRRRSRSAPERIDPAVGHIRAVETHAERNTLLYRGRQVQYRVHLDGDVVYSIAGREIIHDKGDSVVLLQTDRFAIETALRLAQGKFGNSLKLSGSAEFQERAARLAAEAGLDVRFDNTRAEEIRAQRAAELASQRDAGRRYVESQARSQPRGVEGVPDPLQLARKAPDRVNPGQAPDEPEIE